MHFPSEIHQLIIQAATCVPEAFDTSFDAILNEDLQSVLDTIHKSMLTRSTLSLVSKLFHELVEEFLYEIIIIYRFDYIPHLAKLLQSHGRRGRLRGSWCRRLDLRLGTGVIDYNDNAWYEGGHTIWGLIPACPNVIILFCHIWQRRASLFGRTGIMPICGHLTNPALWKAIASTCGPNLQRLDLFGLSIRMDRVEMLLRYCTNLVACRLIHVRPYVYGETYDGDEPQYLQHFFPRGVERVLDTTEGKPSGSFDEQAQMKFQEDKMSAQWPACSLQPPYVLPSLHTLHIDKFNSRITQLHMPCLHYLGMYNDWDTEEYILQEISSSYHSFGSSLTHLSSSNCPMPLKKILEWFPHLKELSLHYCDHDSFTHLTITKPHYSLSIIRFPCMDDAEDMGEYVLDVLSATQAGMLPALTEVLITRWKARTAARWNQEEVYDKVLPFKQFQASGVILNIKEVVEQFTDKFQQGSSSFF